MPSLFGSENNVYHSDDNQTILELGDHAIAYDRIICNDYQTQFVKTPVALTAVKWVVV